jgi:hypothetical protein
MTPSEVIRYDPVGVCIYCGSKDCKLTDEHIIPYALSGTSTFLLPESSCKKCNKIINEQIEEILLRKLFGYTRIAFDMPSRDKRKKQKKKSPPTQVRVQFYFPDGSIGDGEVLISELPRHINLIEYESPGIMVNSRLDFDKVKSILIELHRTEEEETALIKKYGTSSFRVGPPTLRATGAAHPVRFARFLAKMAHGYAVAILGIRGFVPILQEFILGRNPEGIHYVGCLPSEPPNAQQTTLHELNLSHNVPGLGSYVAVRIRLFASFPATPVYCVVVGRSKLVP